MSVLESGRAWEFAMIARKVCYFEILPCDQKRKMVRYGISRRPEAQITTEHAKWKRICQLLQDDGYRLVEIQSDGPIRLS